MCNETNFHPYCISNFRPNYIFMFFLQGSSQTGCIRCLGPLIFKDVCFSQPYFHSKFSLPIIIQKEIWVCNRILFIKTTHNLQVFFFFTTLITFPNFDQSVLQKRLISKHRKFKGVSKTLVLLDLLTAKTLIILVLCK